MAWFIVLIAARGNRSEARRVALDVLPAPSGPSKSSDDRPQPPASSAARLALNNINSMGPGVEVTGRYSASGLTAGRCEVQASVYDSAGRPLSTNPSFGQGLLMGRQPIHGPGQEQPFRILIPYTAFPLTLSAMRPPLQVRSAIVCDGRNVSNVVQSQFVRLGV